VVILIVAALYEEVARLRGRLRFKTLAAPDGMLAFSASVPPAARVVLVLSGTGPRRASAAAAWGIGEYKPDVVISTGFAGGCQDSAETGELVIPTELGSLGGRPGQPSPEGPLIRPDPGLVELISRAATGSADAVLCGLLVSAPSVAADPVQKRAISSALCAVAVDMESYAIAEAANAGDIPFVAVRAISDSLDSRLPSFVRRVTAPRSRWRGLAAARSLVIRPGDIRAAARLSAGAARASRTLAVVLPVMLERIGAADLKALQNR
jgi:adenosylhomocysteine nucleosidase